MCIYIYIYIDIYRRLRVVACAPPEGQRWYRWTDQVFRERGSAPKRGRHSTIVVSTKCIRAVAA